MADGAIRKACDRCHLHKLSCKRVADEACERCLRLHAECKSSPSLRYKKPQNQPRRPQQQKQGQQQAQQGVSELESLQQQHTQQQQQQQQKTRQQTQELHQQPPHQQLHHQPPPPPQLAKQQQEQQPLYQLHPSPSSQQKTPQQPKPRALWLHGAPKRDDGRAESRVRPRPRRPLISSGKADAAPQTGDIATSAHSAVPPDPSLDLSGFGYDFGHTGFLTPSPADALSAIQGAVDVFQGAFAEQWEQQLAASLDTYQQAPPLAFAGGIGDEFRGFEPITIARRPLYVSESAGPDGPLPRTPRPRRRQIELRPVATEPDAEAKKLEPGWMAQLSHINARLLGLASMLPAQHGPGSGSGTGVAAGGAPFPIEDMYDLSSSVATILERLRNKDFGDDASFPDGADPADAMFVLSVYVRLLDLYRRVFALLRLELPRARSGERFEAWKLPDVAVGAFTVDSIPALQLSLTVQLGEELLARLRAAVVRLLPGARGDDAQPTDAGDGGSMFSDVVDVSARAMRAKGEGLAKVLADFRGEIEQCLAA